MDKKLLNKVMKKLASSNVVTSPTVKSSSPSLSMQKKPEMDICRRVLLVLRSVQNLGELTMLS